MHPSDALSFRFTSDVASGDYAEDQPLFLALLMPFEARVPKAKSPYSPSSWSGTALCDCSDARQTADDVATVCPIDTLVH